jgi:uncharacterized repeat protein (TIGR02543 family)
MATVYEWNPYGVALDITATNGGVTRTSATQYTVKINASWETYYSGAQTMYGMTASSGGGSVNLNSFGNSASNGSGSFTGTYSISGNGSATKTITVTFKNYNNDNGDSATKTVSFNVTVPAWTSYVVSYNANGGSGVPSNQTKWKDQTLTLSSTKPTRTGYTFKGWALSKSDADNGTWYYKAGGTCGKNENLTLYATWEENKLTVNYYSNYADYGTYNGAIATVSSTTNVVVHSQDFYYDNTASSGLADVQNTEYLYLSRTGYTPTGYWGTSTSGGTLIDQKTSYATGQALAQAFGKSIASGNASVNVYPQWKINTYTIGYDGNGGYGSMDIQSVDWQETFVLLDNKFKREGYKFVGWNAQREVDRKWYVNGQGWVTEDEIAANGYEKKLYANQDELIFDLSWIKDETGVIHQYTMYAIWEISGVVYIDNGTTFEPYLAYIDNGSSWDLYLVYVDSGTEWNIIS